MRRNRKRYAELQESGKGRGRGGPAANVGHDVFFRSVLQLTRTALPWRDHSHRPVRLNQAPPVVNKALFRIRKGGGMAIDPDLSSFIEVAVAFRG